jgi:hypothetical protein
MGRRKASETPGRFRRDLFHIKRPPDADHQREQQQREHDAEHGQQAAPLIAKRVAHYETAQRHNFVLSGNETPPRQPPRRRRYDSSDMA